MHELLGVAPGADLVLVLDVAPDDPALVRGVLEPVDELVAAPGKLPLGGHRRQAGQYQHRHPSPRRVVHGAAEVLSAAVDVHEHRLGLPADLAYPCAALSATNSCGQSTSSGRASVSAGRRCSCRGAPARRPRRSRCDHCPGSRTGTARLRRASPPAVPSWPGTGRQSSPSPPAGRASPAAGAPPARPGSRTRYPAGSSDQPRRAAIPHRPPGAVSTAPIATPIATRYQAPYPEKFSWTATGSRPWRSSPF